MSEYQIYYPKEDSYFLSGILKKYIKNLNKKKKQNQKILDMGSGSGIQAKTCINLGINPKYLTLIDINKNAILKLKNDFAKPKIIQSNLFDKISKKEKFELIIFNPPYLPKNKYDKQKDITGGIKGSEIINKFLNDAKKYLTKKGKILLLTSSFTKNINFLDYNKKLIAEKKLFFEKLYIWELSFN